ncbi:hypothetical protein SCALM49S_08674 [Streptomyces californicus]
MSDIRPSRRSALHAFLGVGALAFGAAACGPGDPGASADAPPRAGRSRGVWDSGEPWLLDGLRCLREHGRGDRPLRTRGTANPHRSYDLYESVGFRRRNEHVRYRKPISV